MTDIADAVELAIDDELVTRFSVAADHLPSLLSSLNDTQKLNFYGLYKQATVGPCNTDKPGFFDRAGRAKWDAWSGLGAMGKIEAMAGYVEAMAKIDPTWEDMSLSGGNQPPQSKKPMGPVFSSLVTAQDDDDDSDTTDDRTASNPMSIHKAVRSGDLDVLRQALEQATNQVRLYG